MSITSLVNSYLAFNLLLALGSIVFLLIKKINPSFQLKLQYFTIIFFIATSSSLIFLPQEDFTNSTIKVWSAEKMDEITTTPALSSSKIALEFASDQLTSVPKTFPYAIILIFALIVLITLTRLGKELWQLKKLRQTSYLHKKHKRIQIFFSDSISMPFSFSSLTHYYTFLPTALLTEKKDLNISLLHELQHHRQGDTKFVYLFVLIRALCFLNPFAHLFYRLVNESQELACDESLLTRKKVTKSDYTNCLIKAAETALLEKFHPVCAAGFCFNRKMPILRRRIKMMNTTLKPLNLKTKIFLILSILMMGSMSAYATRNLVGDNYLSLQEAKLLVDKASADSDFPFALNEEVLAQLNRYLGTPEGRNFMKASLQRKKAYEQVLTATTTKYQTPYELNAIPIAESGYQNLPSRFSVRAAGLWMFIPGTARKYGMQVNKNTDERLDSKKQTDAAHRYLLSNKQIFNDWLLAIYAYNVGEGALAKGIAQHGTRDVWELSKHIKGDKDYMAKVMASMIIMKNPETLN